MPKTYKHYQMAITLTLITHPNLQFSTGTCNDRQLQCLIGILSPGMVLVTFLPDGKFQQVSSRQFSRDLWDEMLSARFWREGVEPIPRPFQLLKLWMQEIAFHDEPINIEPFSLEPDYPICLDIVSGWTRDILANPDQYEQEDVEAASYELNNWNPTCTHCFTWNTEHTFDSSGRSA